MNLVVLTKLHFRCFLNKFPMCILFNKIVNKIVNYRNKSIYVTFLSFEHIIVWFLYLESIV